MEPEPRKKKRRGYAAHLDGKALVLSHDALLPDVCMKCGSHDGITRREVIFSWSPVWVRYLIFCIIGVLLQLLMRVRASFIVPLCARCNARWSLARYATLGSIGALVVALAAASFLQETHPNARFLGPGMFAFAVLVHFAFVRPRTLPVHRLDEDDIAFMTVNETAINEILAGAHRPKASSASPPSAVRS